jgi:hypothetical protein
MRIAGVRLQAPVARLLAELLAEEHPVTAERIAVTIERRVTTEAPLAAADYEAILETLNRSCPATLHRLHRRLLDEERRSRFVTGT